MILNGQKLHSWRWNEGYAPMSKSLPTFNIQSRSPFRVVAKTLKPYHGKPPLNGDIAQFNQFWNKNGEMGILSVVPLIINGALFGALITEAEGDSIDLDKLEFSQKTALELTSTFAANPELLKAG